MSVRAKLLVIITFVAVVPISILTYTILNVHQTTLETKLSELQERSARYSARTVEANLEKPLADLGPLLSTSIRWHELNEEERDGALLLVYQQLKSVVAVALLNGRSETLARISGLPSGAYGDVAAPTRLSDSELQQLIAAAPLDRARTDGSAHGSPLTLGSERLVLPLSLRVGPVSDPWLVVIGIGLDSVCAELAAERPSGSQIMLFDAAGRSFCLAPDGAEAASGVAPGLLAKLGNGRRSGLRYEDQAGHSMLAATWTTPGGYRVAVAQPVRTAFAPSRRMRLESSLWIAIGVLAAVGAGLLLSRAINQPLELLSRGAQRVAGGDFAVRLAVDGSDELAEVTRSFNHMCGEVERRDREIRAWNEELRIRIDNKTAELERTHNALLESRKIGAMSALAAGVAHEINNPLTGVIGLTQVLIARARKDSRAVAEQEMLKSIEREAQRVGQIVKKMAELSETSEDRRVSEVSLTDALHSVLHARRDQLAQAGIELHESFDSMPPVMGQPEQLVQAFDAVVDNAVKAMRGRAGSLSVTTRLGSDGLARLQVVDTGKGIAPEHLGKVFEPFFTTKEDWNGHGLGLTAAYRVIEAHHGVIRLDSQLDHGTTVTIDLPTRREGAHLQ